MDIIINTGLKNSVRILAFLLLKKHSVRGFAESFKRFILPNKQKTVFHEDYELRLTSVATNLVFRSLQGIFLTRKMDYGI